MSRKLTQREKVLSSLVGGTVLLLLNIFLIDYFFTTLSQQRADNVIRYLVENHNLPLRRIVTPYGYGEAQPVADNKTREGRAENRRVEVKILVSRGLTQEAPQIKTTSSNPE